MKQEPEKQWGTRVAVSNTFWYQLVNRVFFLWRSFWTIITKLAKTSTWFLRHPYYTL